jgi:hypothetical protein
VDRSKEQIWIPYVLKEAGIQKLGHKLRCNVHIHAAIYQGEEPSEEGEEELLEEGEPSLEGEAPSEEERVP